MTDYNPNHFSIVTVHDSTKTCPFFLLVHLEHSIVSYALDLDNF